MDWLGLDYGSRSQTEWRPSREFNARRTQVRIVTAQQQTQIFKDKTLLITGGTGTFGNAVADMGSSARIGEIRIFSRDKKTG